MNIDIRNNVTHVAIMPKKACMESQLIICRFNSMLYAEVIHMGSAILTSAGADRQACAEPNKGLQPLVLTTGQGAVQPLIPR